MKWCFRKVFVVEVLRFEFIFLVFFVCIIVENIGVGEIFEIYWLVNLIGLVRVFGLKIVKWNNNNNKN